MTRLERASWPYALVARKRPTYLLFGLLAGAVYFGLWVAARSFLSWHTSGDGWSYGLSDPGWNEPVVFSLESFWLFISAHFALRGTRADISALEGVVGHEAAVNARARVLRMPMYAWIAMPVLGVSLFATHMWAMGELNDLATWYTRMPGYAQWINSQAAIMYVFMIFLIFSFIRSAMTLYSLGRRIENIDPLNVRPLLRFSRSAPRMTLCLVGALALAIPLEGLSGEFFLVPLMFTLAVGLALFFFPLLGVRRQMGVAKNHALDVLGRALAGDRTALQGTRFAGVNPDQLPEIVTLRRAVEAMPTWPVSHSAWWRLATVIGLPIFSWGMTRFVAHIMDLFAAQ